MQNSRTRTWIVGSMATVGMALGAAGIAGAATGSTTDSAATTAAAAATTAPAAAPAITGVAPAASSSSGAAQTPPDPASLPNGPGETLLTGDTATKVEAAAKAAVPDGTVIRVETDAQGAAYEAHVKKADGTFVTLKLDASFAVTATEDGFGAGPGGGHGAPPAGDPPAGAPGAQGTATTDATSAAAA